MVYKKDLSIIIPVWRGAACYLPKLINSIPDNDGIEIIIVDNSKDALKREEISSERDFIFLHSEPDRHAGGSRNVGIDVAKGKWILFADADDYFTNDAFGIFLSHVDSDADIIFTKPEGIYEDTGERSKRGDMYIDLVHGYCLGKKSEEELRLGFGTPWCKMISHELIQRENIRFDEIRASNDIYFSLVCGYYAKKIEADDRTTYMVTVNHGSLTQRRDYEVIKARLQGKLHCNQFLKSHHLGHRQRSVMFAFVEARRFGVKAIVEMIWMMLKARQTPFVGWRNWIMTAKKTRVDNRENSRYIVR